MENQKASEFGTPDVSASMGQPSPVTYSKDCHVRMNFSNGRSNPSHVVMCETWYEIQIEVSLGPPHPPLLSVRHSSHKQTEKPEGHLPLGRAPPLKLLCDRG